MTAGTAAYGSMQAIRTPKPGTYSPTGADNHLERVFLQVGIIFYTSSHLEAIPSYSKRSYIDGRITELGYSPPQ
jgi:hypothetical protein